MREDLINVGRLAIRADVGIAGAARLVVDEKLQLLAPVWIRPQLHLNLVGEAVAVSVLGIGRAGQKRQPQKKRA